MDKAHHIVFSGVGHLDQVGQAQGVRSRAESHQPSFLRARVDVGRYVKVERFERFERLSL